MKTLTHDQIESVIDWLNSWEQLKGTAIPLRFKEDWTNKLNSHSNIDNTPLGLKPKWIHDLYRKKEITEAIQRYIEHDKDIPREWVK